MTEHFSDRHKTSDEIPLQGVTITTVAFPNKCLTDPIQKKYVCVTHFSKQKG